MNKIISKAKEVFKNPVVKISVIGLPVVIGGVLGYKKYTQKKQWESYGTSKAENGSGSSVNTTTTATTTSYDNSIGLKTYNGYQYDIKTLMIGRSRYEFTMRGVEKLQRFMASKSRKAAEHIANNGGFDGQIGKGFIKALDAYLSEGSSKLIALKALLKNSGLKSSEFKIQQ
ncbi:MAG: hypothetical protein PF448_06380 [Bacteroidales bacterium]|jgi:hypothetical protein|nr:hypothetical protein [Bacteroidales bacterium]